MSAPRPPSPAPVTALSLVIVGLVIAAALAAGLAGIFLPDGDPLGRYGRRIAAGIIFAGSYLALAIGRIPGLNIDRAGISLVGAGLMVASGALPLSEAYRAVDLDTITLLLGMMIVVASLRLSGFFAVANHWVGSRAGTPLVLLAAIVTTSGLLSAFLVNDAICLVLAPLVLELCLSLGRRPLPYLLGVATASNVGSVATITGNPQNIMIGSFSGIPYLRFALVLGPIAIVGLLLTIGLVALFHRDEFFGGTRLDFAPGRVAVKRVLMIRALIGTLVMVGLFFTGLAPAEVAIVIGGLLLLTRRIKSRRVYAEIDWSLLLMFAGLFIIVAGAEKALLGPAALAAAAGAHLDQVPVLALVTAVLSNLVSNVPAVLMLKPFVEGLADRDRAWLVVAMASTLAGNFTVLGSIANLIVVQRAGAVGIVIGFRDYFRIGAPLTLVTLTLGTLWLWL
jgi:Na+/H+ antiporter NhaD/arsenite permease-like protein